MICLLRDEAGDQEQEQADFRQASRRLTRARFEDQEGRNPSQGCGNRAFQFPGRSSPHWAIGGIPSDSFVTSVRATPQAELVVPEVRLKARRGLRALPVRVSLHE